MEEEPPADATGAKDALTCAGGGSSRPPVEENEECPPALSGPLAPGTGDSLEAPASDRSSSSSTQRSRALRLLRTRRFLCLDLSQNRSLSLMMW